MPGTNSPGGNNSDNQRSEIIARLLRGELDVREACERHGLTPESLGNWVRVFRRSTLKAFDEHVRTTLSRQGVDAATLSTAELTGTLDEVEVSDLLQTMGLSRRDCEICVTHGGVESRVWCAAGEIVDAESGGLLGEHAVYRTLALEEGHVVADLRPATRQRTIGKSTPLLLLEGARRKDECKRLRAHLGPERYAPGPEQTFASESLTSEELELQHELLRRFDGARSVDEVLTANTLGDLETLTAIASLVSRKHLVPAAGHGPVHQVADADSVSVRPVLVSLLAAAPRIDGGSSPRAKRARTGLIAGSLLALSAVCWLAFAGSVRGRSAERVPAVRAPSVGLPTPSLARPSPSVAPPAPTAALPAPAVSERPLDEATALPASETARAPAVVELAARPAAPESTPRTVVRQRVPKLRRRSKRRAASTRPQPRPKGPAPAPQPTAPRMQIIEEQTPTMRIVD